MKLYEKNQIPLAYIINFQSKIGRYYDMLHDKDEVTLIKLAFKDSKCMQNKSIVKDDDLITYGKCKYHGCFFIEKSKDGTHYDPTILVHGGTRNMLFFLITYINPKKRKMSIYCMKEGEFEKHYYKVIRKNLPYGRSIPLLSVLLFQVKPVKVFTYCIP